MNKSNWIQLPASCRERAFCYQNWHRKRKPERIEKINISTKQQKKKCFNWLFNTFKKGTLFSFHSIKLLRRCCKALNSGKPCPKHRRFQLFNLVYPFWRAIQSKRCDWIIWRWSDGFRNVYSQHIFCLPPSASIFKTPVSNFKVNSPHPHTRQKKKNTQPAFRDYPDYFVMIVLSGSFSHSLSRLWKATNRRRSNENIAQVKNPLNFYIVFVVSACVTIDFDSYQSLMHFRSRCKSDRYTR